MRNRYSDYSPESYSETQKNQGSPPERPPNCLKCLFFKVVWDADFPRGARACTIFSIKCINLPSHEVFRATGANCPVFTEKEGLK